jgi:hypothetical protein
LMNSNLPANHHFGFSGHEPEYFSLGAIWAPARWRSDSRESPVSCCRSNWAARSQMDFLCQLAKFPANASFARQHSNAPYQSWKKKNKFRSR